MKILTIESPTHGTHHVLLDDDDYDRVIAEGKWYIYRDTTSFRLNREVFYVRRSTPRDENGKQKKIHLHRFIMDAPKGKVVDHINGDGRDNRKENLRICTIAENSRNCNRPPQGKVGYYGVKLLDEGLKKYEVRITVDKKLTFRGGYYTAEEAALAYDKRAKELHGEFATLNFPDGPPPDVIQKILDLQQSFE